MSCCKVCISVYTGSGDGIGPAAAGKKSSMSSTTSSVAKQRIITLQRRVCVDMLRFMISGTLIFFVKIVIHKLIALTILTLWADISVHFHLSYLQRTNISIPPHANIRPCRLIFWFAYSLIICNIVVARVIGFLCGQTGLKELKCNCSVSLINCDNFVNNNNIIMIFI